MMKFNKKIFQFNTKINLYGRLVTHVTGIEISIDDNLFRLPFLDYDQVEDDLNYLKNNWDDLLSSPLGQFYFIKDPRLCFYIQSIYLNIKGLNKQYFDLNKNNNFQLVLDGDVQRYPNIKFKISNNNDLINIEQFLKNDPSLKIRLDGNRTLKKNMISNLNSLYNKYFSQIDFIEEPFKDSTLNNLIKIPIAFDESLNFENILTTQKILILKPALIGGVIKTQELIKLYPTKRFILSSFYEPRELYNGYQYLVDLLDKNEIHGLSTYQFWEN